MSIKSINQSSSGRRNSRKDQNSESKFANIRWVDGAKNLAAFARQNSQGKEMEESTYGNTSAFAASRRADDFLVDNRE